jgi:membrane protein implicated in regulation of membrane protease activity
LTWPLKQRWFWTLFLSLLAVVLGAFVIVFLILSFSPNLIILALVAVLIIWVVVRSYRNWAAHQSEEEHEATEHQFARRAPFIVGNRH